MTAAGVRLDGVSACFTHSLKGTVYAVRNVSLDVAPGELMTLLGPSGCGKTTTLPPIVAVKVPYGKEQIDKLLPTNWSVVNEKRAEWTNRWNRTVER